jgi:hypothetical protein
MMLGMLGIVVVAAVLLISVGGFAMKDTVWRDYYGTPNGPDLPAGGITKEMAIDRARLGDDARAYAEERGGWVWHVTRSDYDSRGGCEVNVIIDFFTGEQLDWYLICGDTFD